MRRGDLVASATPVRLLLRGGEERHAVAARLDPSDLAVVLSVRPNPTDPTLPDAYVLTPTGLGWVFVGLLRVVGEGGDP
mgnify:CR=1 FL=1